MKKVLLQTTAAAAAAIALSAGAWAQGGYVSAEVGTTNVDIFGSDTDYTTGNLEAAHEGSLGGGSLGYQIKGQATIYDGDFIEEELYRVEAHLTSGNLAAFATVADVADETVWGIGIEGRAGSGPVQFSGQLGYVTADDLDVDVVGVGGQVAYQATPTVKLTGRATYGNVDFGGGFDDDYHSLGGEIAYRPTGSRWEVFGGLTHGSLDFIPADATTAFIGVRVDFGEGGANWRGAEGLLDPLLR